MEERNTEENANNSMSEEKSTEQNVGNAGTIENVGNAENVEKPEDPALSNATEPKRKQWHGPFFGSMRLELRSNKKGYVYAGEYPLNMKSLLIDMLVVANNKEIFEQLIQEEKNMCQALRELMDDVVKEEVNDAERRGEARGIKIGEARAATTIGDILCRLSSGEDEESIRSSGVNNEVLAIARSIFQRQMTYLHTTL